MHVTVTNAGIASGDIYTLEKLAGNKAIVSRESASTGRLWSKMVSREPMYRSFSIDVNESYL